MTSARPSAESRPTVYDVLEMHNKGYNLYEISTIFNLTPLQVQTALRYLELHRERLERELAETRQIRAERERRYHAIAAEVLERIAAEPMTPQRAAFYALREKNRRIRKEKWNAGCSD